MATPSDTNVSSASKERAAGQPERYAHGSVQIAEACAAAIFDEWRVVSTTYDCFGTSITFDVLFDDVVERIAKTLDASHASPCEGTKPNA